MHSSFFSVRIPRDLFGVCGIGPSGSLVRWIFTGSVSPRVCHSCLPSWYFTGDLVFPCWSDFLSRTPRGFVLCWAGGKFLPSFNSGLGVFLQGVPPPGLALLLPPLVCNQGRVLPIRVQTPSLGPSGVVFQLGVGGKFPPFCAWLGGFYRECRPRVRHSCHLHRNATRDVCLARQGSNIVPGTLRGCVLGGGWR